MQNPRKISSLSATMIGSQVDDRHAQGRQDFQKEATVIADYTKQLHPYRKQGYKCSPYSLFYQADCFIGHLQLNYPSTLQRLRITDGHSSPPISATNTSTTTALPRSHKTDCHLKAGALISIC